MTPRLMRAVAAVAAGLTWLTAAALPASAVAGFGDVAPDRYFTDAVQWMADEGITDGVSPSCFATTSATTRGEAAAFIWRAEGRPTAGPAHAFADVTASWQQDPVSWMAATGITTGTSTTTFSPDRPVTRGEAATFLYRYHGTPAVTVDPATPTCLPWHRGGTNPTPADAAVEFAEFVGLTNPTFSEFRQGDSRSGEIEITTEPAPATPYTTTTVFVRLDATDNWVVIGAASDAVDVVWPPPDAVVSSPVIMNVLSRNFARVRVELWPAGAAAPAAETSALGFATLPLPADVNGPATILYISDDTVVTGHTLAVTTQQVTVARPM